MFSYMEFHFFISLGAILPWRLNKNDWPQAKDKMIHRKKSCLQRADFNALRGSSDKSWIRNISMQSLFAIVVIRRYAVIWHRRESKSVIFNFFLFPGRISSVPTSRRRSSSTMSRPPSSSTTQRVEAKEYTPTWGILEPMTHSYLK